VSCAYIHKNKTGPNKENMECQFNVAEHELTKFSGQLWCQFHLPLENEKGEKSDKAKWTNKTDTFNSTIIKNIANFYSHGNLNLPYDLSGTIFPSEFPPDYFPKQFNGAVPNIDWNNCTFYGPADFQGAKFNAEANFEGSIFKSSAFFQKATFGKRAIFNNAEFHSSADFNGTTFESDGVNAEFKNVKFYGDTAEFINPIFSGKAIFDGSLFETELKFFVRGPKESEISFSENTTFSEKTHFSFSNNTFQGSLAFKEANFHNEVTFEDLGSDTDFSNATFCDEVSFKGRSQGEATFQEAKFIGNAIFTINFTSITSFQNSKFFNNAVFRGCEFSKFANFKEAHFCKNIEKDKSKAQELSFEFTNCRIGSGSNWKHANFHGESSFQNTKFAGNNNFEHSTFYRKIDFSCTEDNRESSFFELISFFKAIFCGPVTFLNRRFTNSTNFSETTFKYPPSFHNCTLHQDTNFIGTKFENWTHSSAFLAYRTLKQFMEDRRARREEAMFYALEQKALRNLRNTSRTERFISHLYDLVSEYGQNIWRPFILWLGIQGLAFSIYWWLGVAGYSSDVSSTFIFTLRQIIVPTEILKNTPGLGTGIILLTVIHSLLSISTLFLFFQTVRRQFRMI